METITLVGAIHQLPSDGIYTIQGPVMSQTLTLSWREADRINDVFLRESERYENAVNFSYGVVHSMAPYKEIDDLFSTRQDLTQISVTANAMGWMVIGGIREGYRLRNHNTGSDGHYRFISDDEYNSLPQTED